MTTEQTVQWAEEVERTPDDFRHGLLAIVSLAPDTSLASIAGLLAYHHGRRVASGRQGLVLTIATVPEAAAFASALQAARMGDGPPPVIGINLGTPRFTAGGRAGPDVAFAHALRRRAEPGETLISAVTGDRLTSRVRAEGRNEPAGWRGWILPGIGLAGFLAYFFGWFYAIYWKLEAYATTGSFPCWPEWLCR